MSRISWVGVLANELPIGLLVAKSSQWRAFYDNFEVVSYEIHPYI
ncbi:hypothetical protein [Vibrio maerlii]|nr:hypothetical protein [Vibrio maerlii]